MQLERELATYEEKLPELVQHEGEYVLIHAEDVAGTFVSCQDAVRQGYREFGREPFRVKQICAIEPILFITRRIAIH